MWCQGVQERKLFEEKVTASNDADLNTKICPSHMAGQKLLMTSMWIVLRRVLETDVESKYVE